MTILSTDDGADRHSPRITSMLQVLLRIPTDSPWFFVGGVLICLAGAFVFTWWGGERDKRPPFQRVFLNMVITGVVGLFLLWIISNQIETIPLYGFGMMLFLAFVTCLWVGSRRAERVGIPKERFQDVAIILFVGGVIGARVTFLIVEDPNTHWSNFFTLGTLKRFFYFWDGGLVYYGSLIGGVISIGPAYYYVLRRNHIGFWKMADVLAPTLALGLCLGRIGCLLNGCCFGDVAAADCTYCFPIRYPLAAEPRFVYTRLGDQTAAGFTLYEESFDRPAEAVVRSVEPDSDAFAKGLRADDEIKKADGHEISTSGQLEDYLTRGWPRGKNDLTLEVRREKRYPNGEIELDEKGRPEWVTETIGPFRPRSIGLYPTQIHESISALLIFLLLLAVEPFIRREGMLMILFLLLYPIHRFVDEMLRNDTEIFRDHMTLSQNISIIVFICAIVLGVILWRRPELKTATA
jgi:prolipoprotein diacylglyceryl transferase